MIILAIIVAVTVTTFIIMAFCVFYDFIKDKKPAPLKLTKKERKELNLLISEVESMQFKEAPYDQP